MDSTVDLAIREYMNSELKYTIKEVVDTLSVDPSRGNAEEATRPRTTGRGRAKKVRGP